MLLAAVLVSCSLLFLRAALAIWELAILRRFMSGSSGQRSTRLAFFSFCRSMKRGLTIALTMRFPRWLLSHFDDTLMYFPVFPLQCDFLGGS